MEKRGPTVLRHQACKGDSILEDMREEKAIGGHVHHQNTNYLKKGSDVRSMAARVEVDHLGGLQVTNLEQGGGEGDRVREASRSGRLDEG